MTMHTLTSNAPGFRGLIPDDIAPRLDAAGRRRWLSRGYVPRLAGGSPDDGGGDGGDGSGDGDGDGDGEGAADGDGDGDGAADGDGDGDGDGEGDGDDATAALEAKLAKAEQEKRAAEKRAATAERKLTRQRRQTQEDQGEYKTMYEEQKAENEKLQAQLRDGALERAVVAEATAQQFKNPTVALSLVRGNLKDAVDEDGDVDEALVKRELTKLAKRETYLVEDKRPQGGGAGRGDRNGDGANGNGGNGNEGGDITGVDGMSILRGAIAETSA